MKRRKLELSRQTLQRLDSGSLAVVRGGGKTTGWSSEWTQGINCAQSEQTYCGCDATYGGGTCTCP